MANYSVESASKYSVTSSQGSKYSVESAQDTPEKASSLPQDQRSIKGASIPLSKGNPSFRQGSVADMDPRPLAEQWHSTEQQGPPTYAEHEVGAAASLPSRAIGKVFSMLPTGVGGASTLPSKALSPAMEPYNEKVLSKSRESLFGPTQPLDYTASPGDIVKHNLIEMGQNFVSDPLMLGLGVFGASRFRPPLRQSGQPATPITTPVVDAPARRPGDPLLGKPAQPGTPPIQDLAKGSPAQQHQEFRTSATPQSPGEPFAPQRDMRLGELPTGSIERQLGPAGASSTVGHAPELRSLPTGSMLRIQRPDLELSAGKQYTAPVPEVPSMRRDPTVADQNWESRPLHGRPHQLPSAEDLLAANRSAQQARWDQYQSDMTRQNPQLRQTGTSGSGIAAPAVLDLMDLLRQPEQAPLIPRSPEVQLGQLPTKSATMTQAAPSLFQRLTGHATDTLRAMGPYSGRIGDILDYIVADSEAGTKQNFLDYSALVSELYGSRSLRARLGTALSGDWQNALNRSIQHHGMTEPEVKALIELHYRGDKLPTAGPLSPAAIEKAVSAKAWETLKSQLLDPKVQRLFQEGWKIMTGRASAFPSVQNLAKVHDVITGESKPVGAPSPYWPHQAVKESTTRILAEHTLRQMYKDGGYEGKGISYQGFVKQFKAHIQDSSREAQLRRFAGLENKRYLDMHADATAHGRTIADSLKFYGYETDPLRVLLHHNMYAIRRARFLEHQDELAALRSQLSTEYGHGPKSFHEYTERVIDAFQGISHNENMMSRTSEGWNIAQAIMYPAFLKASWLQNLLLQPNYGFMVTGITPIVKSLMTVLGKKAGLTDKDLLSMSERSASNYPTFLAKYHMPNGLAEQYGKAAMTANWFPFSDMVTRHLQGVFFGVRAENLVRKWWSDQTNPKYQNALKEGKLNLDALREKMLAAPKDSWSADGTPPIPPEFLMRYEQTMTNRAMGRTGIQSQPLWAASDDRFTKLFMMLHRQVVSNEGVFIHNITHAPTAGIGLMRALRGFGGAAFAGTVYQGISNWIMGNGFFDVNEPLAKQMGSKEAAFAIKAVLLGLGTFSAGLILSGLNASAGNAGGMTYGIVSPPAAAFIDEFANKLMKGKFDEAALRLNPLQTPDVLYKREKKEKQKRKQSDSIGMGTGIGL